MVATGPNSISAVARNGTSMWKPPRKERSAIQRQLTNSRMGATAGNSRIIGFSPPYSGTSPSAQTKRDMPDHTTPHCRRREFYDGYPIAVLW